MEQMRMEEFFKDLYYDFQSSPNASLTRNAYIQLVELYTRVLRDTTSWLCEDGRRGAPVGRMLAAAADPAERLTLITFNHGLVIENEIFKRARLRRRWCLERGYGLIGDEMVLLRSGISGADFPVHSPDCDHSRPIEVLKLHGSLSWVVLELLARDEDLLSGVKDVPRSTKLSLEVVFEESLEERVRLLGRLLNGRRRDRRASLRRRRLDGPDSLLRGRRAAAASESDDAHREQEQRREPHEHEHTAMA